MEDALYEIASMRRFAGLELLDDALPDETTILSGATEGCIRRRRRELHEIVSSQLVSAKRHGYHGGNCALTSSLQELKMSRADPQSCGGSAVVFGPGFHKPDSYDQ